MMFDFTNVWLKKSAGTYAEQVEKLKKALSECDAVLIGAGSGLSTSAGFTYSGERFEKFFRDFADEYHFADMYTGGFRVMLLPPEELWAYWSRNIYINRYMDPPKPVYKKLFELVRDKDYFVLTTNVDHCFQKAGFDKQRIFYTQGDYGLWQCSEPCHDATYDNAETVRKMVLSQGFVIAEDGTLTVPKGVTLKMTVPAELVPRCPVCGKPMSMNLRADDTFVEDAGWHAASRRYADYLEAHDGQRLLLLELGVGGNTPVIIKYPFWRMTEKNRNATYACVNLGDAEAPGRIADRAICIDADIGATLEDLR